MKTKGKILLTVVCWIICTLLLGAIYFVGVNDYKKATSLTYEDLEYFEFTVKETEKDFDTDYMFASYVISVNETDGKLNVAHKICTKEVSEKISRLEQNDTVYCYALKDDKRYDVFELSSGSVIFSLEDYRRTYHEEKFSTFYTIPIVIGVLWLAFPIIIVIEIKKSKKPQPLKLGKEEDERNLGRL